MEKFINANKEVFVVTENDDFKDEYIDKLENDGIHVISSEFIADYSDVMEDITDAFLNIEDSVKSSYFRKATREELVEVWKEAGYENEELDEELAMSFYYEDCVMEAINEDAYDFLEWLACNNSQFTYITIEQTDYVDLIQYHQYGSKSELLEDEDFLEKVFFEEWYSVRSEDSKVETQFSLKEPYMLDRYMLDNYNAIDFTVKLN